MNPMQPSEMQFARRSNSQAPQRYTPPSAYRIRILMAVVLVLGAVFIVRLFYIQIIRHDYYQAEASKEHIAKFIIPAKRGEIFAKDGPAKFVPLVLNEPAYTVFADARYVKDAGKVADVLRRIAGGNTVQGFEEGLRDSTRQYVV